MYEDVIFFFISRCFQVVFDRLKGMALIMYNNTDFAQAAVRETKGWKIGGNKIKVKKEKCMNYPRFL